MDYEKLKRLANELNEAIQAGKKPEVSEVLKRFNAFLNPLKKQYLPNIRIEAENFCYKQGVTLEEITVKTRLRNIVEIRQALFYELHKKQGYSAPATGKVLNQGHSNVLHACKTVENQYKTYEKYF